MPYSMEPKGINNFLNIEQHSKKLDYYEVINQFGGTKLFLLLNGHGRHLGLPFLDINSEGNLGVVCIGFPYGTSLW